MQIECSTRLGLPGVQRKQLDGDLDIAESRLVRSLRLPIDEVEVRSARTAEGSAVEEDHGLARRRTKATSAAR
jgi:hypothetical protein